MDRIKESHSSNIIRLAPLPVWKWVLVYIFLLLIPLFILIDQNLASFKAIMADDKKQIQSDLEKLVGRFKSQMDPLIQFEELLQEYADESKSDRDNLTISAFSIPLWNLCLPFTYEKTKQIIQFPYSSQLVKREKVLRKFIRGIKIIRWDENSRIKHNSDKIFPGWPYLNLLESILLRENRKDKNDRSYNRNFPKLKRYFGKTAPLNDICRDSNEGFKFRDPSGQLVYMLWNEESVSVSANQKARWGGELYICFNSDVVKNFGPKVLVRRKSHEWKRKEQSIGWINPRDMRDSYLPAPIKLADQKIWHEWLAKQTTGNFERDGILFSVFRVNSTLALVGYQSIENVYDDFKWKLFGLIILALLIILSPALIVGFSWKNGGVSISVRWQMFGLFLLAIGLPTIGVYQFGSELLREKKKSVEKEAFNRLEQIKIDFDKNYGFAFEQLEVIGDRFCQELASFPVSLTKKSARTTFELHNLIKRLSGTVNVTNFHLFDDSGDVLYSEPREASKDQLKTLMSSLVKLRLKWIGKLKDKGNAGMGSLMDLMLEETGGSSLVDIEQLLRSDENKTFELKSFNRTINCFIGTFYQKHNPDRPFVLSLVIKDSHFERLYARFLIKKFEQENTFNGKIQLFLGRNKVSSWKYFYPTALSNPWFRYDHETFDSNRLGRLSEPTRFTGLAVKDIVELKENKRKCLFYSFAPLRFKSHSIVALYDYAEITSKLERLKRLILIVFGISLLISLILARLMGRGLVAPIDSLKQGVKSVEEGNFETEILLPGQDELVELAGAFNHMAKGLLERERMTKFLSKSAVEAVKQGEDSNLGGKRVAASILFSDIRSFTTISESNSAEEVVSLLNDYFAVMNTAIEESGGDIDKFIGDAIMAQFIARPGEETTPEELAERSIKCGIKMMEVLHEFNKKREAKGLFKLGIGVGINSGEVISGNIGSPGRMDHTVIGDTVNVASRLEGMSKLGKHTNIIISRSTLDLVKGSIEYEQLAETSVKGKSEAVEMFEVIRLRS